MATVRSAGEIDSLGDGGVDGEPPSQRRRLDTEGGSFQVFVKTLSGATVILWVTLDSSILSVKERLSDKLGWWMTRPGSLSLVFQGMELQNDRSLISYNIQEGNLLHHAPIAPTGAAEKEDMEDMEPPEEEEGPPEEGPPEDGGTVSLPNPDASPMRAHFLELYI